MTSPEMAAKGDAGSAGIRSGVPAAASESARTTMRRAGSILKPLSPEGFAAASAASAARRKSVASARAPARISFCIAGAPGFHGNAAECEARIGNLCILETQSGRSGDDRKCIGHAFADFW